VRRKLVSSYQTVTFQKGRQYAEVQCETHRNRVREHPYRGVETRVSLSAHDRILPLPKHHPALILRTSLVPPRTFIFIFIDSAHARVPAVSRSITHFLSIPCPLVFIGAFLMLFPLSNISPNSYSHRCVARGIENPYYMYRYLYLAYLARNFGPAHLATLAVLHICWTSCRCSGLLFPPATSSV
jgi:hypothetical protein